MNAHETVDRLAQVLWDYHNIQTPLVRSDFILGLGSHDLRVANRSAELFLAGFGHTLVFSGGFGKVTRDLWGVSEAEQFAKIATLMGVSADQILIESRATNTGDNLRLTRELFAEKDLKPRTGIVVTKPYMKRRALATAAKQWPEVKWLVDSPSVGYLHYPDEDTPKDRMIQLMVGDLQRLEIYADRGFQTPQVIPASVWAAYEQLVDLGFDQFVIRD